MQAAMHVQYLCTSKASLDDAGQCAPPGVTFGLSFCSRFRKPRSTDSFSTLQNALRLRMMREAQCRAQGKGSEKGRAACLRSGRTRGQVCRSLHKDRACSLIVNCAVACSCAERSRADSHHIERGLLLRHLHRHAIELLVP